MRFSVAVEFATLENGRHFVEALSRPCDRRLEVCPSADSVNVIVGARLVASHTRSAFKGTETLVFDH